MSASRMAPSSMCGRCNHHQRQPLLLLIVAFAAAYGLPFGWASMVANDPEALLQTLRDRAETVRKCAGVPGLAVGYVKGSERRTFGLGVADISTKQPVTGSTLFGIASLTKAFSSGLLAELLPKHGLKWDSLLKDIIPGFRMNTTLLTDHATLADALAHRTGVTEFPLPVVMGYRPSVSRRELERRTQFHVPKLQFRTTLSYNNHMYAVGGATVEHITGKIWEDLINETFFVPLKMKSSSFTQSWRTEPYLSKSHIRSASEENMEIPLESLEIAAVPFGPEGSILSSANDMVKWLSFNLERLKNGSDAWSTVFTSHVPINGHPLENGAGLGWMRGQYGDVPFWTHGGSLDGYCSSAVLLHAHDSALFLAMNKWCGDLGNVTTLVTRMLAETVLGLPLTANESAICATLGGFDRRLSAAVGGVGTNETERDRDLQCVIGTFSHPAYGDIVTTSNGSAAKWSYGRYAGTLVPVGPDDRMYVLRYEGWLEAFNYYPVQDRLNFSADCQRLLLADYSEVSFLRRQDVRSSAGSTCLGSLGIAALALLSVLVTGCAHR